MTAHPHLSLGWFSPTSLAFAGFLALAIRLTATVSISVQGVENPAFPRQYAPGSALQFNVTPVAPAGALYQWYLNDAPIPGAIRESLSVASLTTANTGNYRVVVTTGGSIESSAFATINVLPFPALPLDLSFHPQLPAGLVPKAVMFGASNGSLIVTDAAGRMIRLNADGSRDLSVDLGLGSRTLLAVLADGDLIVNQSPFRIHGDGSSGAFTLPTAFDGTQPLAAAVVQTDGKIIIGQGKNIARLNVDGSVDVTFTAPLAIMAVRRLELDSSGRTLVSSYDIRASQTTPSESVIYTVVQRLLVNGQSDTGFQVIGYFQPVDEMNERILWVLGDGALLLELYQDGGGPYFQRIMENGVNDPRYFGSLDALKKSVVIDGARRRAYYLDHSSVLRAADMTSSGFAGDTDFYAGFGYAQNAQVTPSGELLTLPDLQLLRTTDSTVFPAVVTIFTNRPPVGGAVVFLESEVKGTGPFSYQWLALDGQSMPPETKSGYLYISLFTYVHLGRWQLRVTNSAGSVLSPVLTLTSNPTRPAFLANLSGRAYVGSGEATAIAGFSVRLTAGSAGLGALLRGAGPALQPFGVVGFLPDPTLKLYDAANNLTGSNDDWSNDTKIAAASAASGAFGFAKDSRDAAILRVFGEGNATLQMTDQGGGTGIGLLEIYRQADAHAGTSDGDFVNLSLRAMVGPGDRAAIVGFVVSDPENFNRRVRVLLRAVGPTLAQYGVGAPLGNPILTLYDVRGNVVARNDNWSDGDNAASLSEAMRQVGAFGLADGSKDAAILVDLPPGVYSAQAVGSGDGTGIALTEIYLVRALDN